VVAMKKTYLIELVLRKAGVFAKLRKTTVSFVMSVRLSACPSAWNTSAPIGRISMKFNIFVFFENMARKISFFKT